MKLEYSLKESHAISFNEETVNKLFTLLKEYYNNDNIIISSKLQNEADISFESIEELLSYENLGEFRLNELTIKSNGTSDYRIEIKKGSHFFFTYGSTITIRFSLDNIDQCIGFRAKLKYLLKEIRLPFSYTILSKISIPIVIWFFSILFSLFFYLQPTSNSGNSIPISTFVILILIVAIIIGVIFVLNLFWVKLFPPIYYLWGKENLRFEKITKIRSKIFWVIFIGLIVGIIASILSRFI